MARVVVVVMVIVMVFPIIIVIAVFISIAACYRKLSMASDARTLARRSSIT